MFKQCAEANINAGLAVWMATARAFQCPEGTLHLPSVLRART
jgi:hypothetical protein